MLTVEPCGIPSDGYLAYIDGECETYHRCQFTAALLAIRSALVIVRLESLTTDTGVV